MRRTLLALLSFVALSLTLGCRHVAGVNDCGGDIPICGQCHGEDGCGIVRAPVVTPRPIVVPPGQGKGSGTGSGSGSVKGSGEI